MTMNFQCLPSNLPFHDYIAETYRLLTHKRKDLSQPHADTILKANMPYEIPGDNPRCGVLLIHGLYESPYTLSHIADFFGSRNYLVRGLLLPGHGTTPEDLLDVHYEQWVNATRYAIESFTNQVDKLYIVGQSTGATLAVYHALSGVDFAGMILFSPALKIKNPFAGLSGLFARCGRYIPRVSWLAYRPETDYAKYESLTFNSVYQVCCLVKLVQNLMAKNDARKLRLFLVATQEDGVVDHLASLRFFQRFNHDESRGIIYSARPSANIIHPNIDIVPSYIPEQNILQFSHICLPIPSTDPHYGKLGDYTQFLLGKYGDVDPANVYYGEMSMLANPGKHLIRLPFNTYFDDLLEQLDRFIENT